MSPPTTPSIRVLCVDDHPLVRKGIGAILANEPGMTLVAEGSNGRQGFELFCLHKPDVMLMDIRMPDMDGITATRLIREQFPAARIIALTSYDGDQDIFRALEAGVMGYLLKDMVHTDVLQAIRTVHFGKRFVPGEVAERLTESFGQETLTARELEVLACLARGLANKEIASELGVATGTVKIHVEHILAKLGTGDRTQAVTTAIRRGILHP